MKNRTLRFSTDGKYAIYQHTKCTRTAIVFKKCKIVKATNIKLDDPENIKTLKALGMGISRIK